MRASSLLMEAVTELSKSQNQNVVFEKLFGFHDTSLSGITYFPKCAIFFLQSLCFHIFIT